MPKLWNVLLTTVVLGAAYVTTIALTYDGYCYGYMDGKASCSFAEHVADKVAWSGFLLIMYLPHVLIVGGVVYLVNDAVYRAVVALSARRWQPVASDAPFSRCCSNPKRAAGGRMPGPGFRTTLP